MVDRSIFIPERPEELTPEWLNSVLKDQLDGHQIVGARQTVVGEGEGFVGDIILFAP